MQIKQLLRTAAGLLTSGGRGRDASFSEPGASVQQPFIALFPKNLQPEKLHKFRQFSIFGRNIPIQTSNPDSMMKKLLACALFAIASCTIVSAQNKGEMYVGGILGVSTSSFSADETSTSQTYFRIAPEFGYFVRDNLRVGGSLGYSIAPLEGRTTHTVTIGPNVAYYVKVCDRIYYVPEIGLGFAYASFDGVSGVGLDSEFKFGAFEYRHSAKWSLSLNLMSLDYTTLSFSGENATSNDVAFQLGISPTVGFKFYF